ncbi:fungal specific transcription factor [Aspergillus oryzae 100-8]|uniref:Fungal specific transcription factor n=1 Tax=Aspergillus oryzae (strain 3.042) TaxID=1160506 RepID=I8A5N2_ASPO3|nr:fungal specific transcription factor [Aspergillus oryzae 3.042]KDE81752.1 fungal specific transcription factor [Aspergillus oryzae 100-8]|eukprot:EIT79924.1 fungal specific transcription factor [Aspergillus oryzae 3.042]
MAPPPAHDIDHLFGSRKMAIPRLAEGAESAFTSPGRFHRRHVSRACESCRQRKTKCTGDKSGCRNCKEAGIICCYTDGKREKSKRQMASLEGKIQAYEDVLRKLSIRFGISDEQLMSFALAESAAESATQPDAYAATPEDRKFFWVLGSEPYLSTTSLVSHIADHTEEDFNRDDFTRATGFIGKSSEISWLQMLSKYVNSGSSSNYHLDDFDMPTVERLDTSELPSKDTATKLFNAYLSSVHPSFPIIGISTFASQFQAFFHNPSLKPGNKWLAILNLIFAIGARYAHLTNAEWRRDRDDHYSYFIRGQLLHHSDLQQLQVEGLASFYMLSSGHINRSWKLCGSAVRSALSLGLHLRNIGTCTSDTSKEIRYRVWWALYTLEHRLSVMTGRPSCIIDVACTTPLPVPFDESDFRKESVMRLINRSTPEDLGQPGPASNSSPNSNLRKTGKGMESADANAAAPCKSLYFLQLIKLTSIAKRMTSKLYNPDGVEKAWSSMEFAIRGLMLDLDSWLINLPAAYDFTSTHTSQGSATHRMSLALTFYSTKIGITKPCLRRIESSALGDKSEEFCRKAAAECVESACHMLRLFPEPLEASLLHKLSPWWCILHFLMQATAVLLIELSFHVQHVPEKAAMVSKAAKKSYDWLAVMSETSMASEKARRMCDEFLRRLGFNGGAEIHSFPCIAGLASRNSLTRIATPDGLRGGIGSIPLSPVDHSTAAFARPLSVGLEAPEAHEFDQDEKALTVHNLYDGYLPYDPNTGQITGSFFPPEDDIDIGLGPYYWDEAMGDHYYQQPASASPVIPNDPR